MRGTTGERHLKDLLPGSTSAMIAGLFVSSPRGKGLGLGVVGDEGEEMIGDGGGTVIDTSIAPGMLMVDEARRSTASLADCLFLGNENPAECDIVKVTSCYDARGHSEGGTFPQSMEMPEHRRTCVRKM
jgi:hypothetical protein